MIPLLSDITTRLSLISASAALDSSVLIAHILDKPRTWVMAHTELTLTSDQQKKLDDSLSRLELGEPLPYVLGHWEFFGLDFKVTPDVLIPRPETELLVERAIAWLKQNPGQRSVADVGTGSGAIAVSIAVNVPDAKTLATDISPDALNVAKQNAEKHGVSDRVDFIECDLLPMQSPIENRKPEIDLLCANLPYIPAKILQGLSVLKREPALALDGGDDGFELIQRLMKTAPDNLAPNSLMLFEIEATLGEPAVRLARDILPNANVQLHQDLSGRDRLLEIELL
jgi:release factor glutamine methyltransferase